jgi:AcrR family transcriptional regulator
MPKAKLKKGDATRLAIEDAAIALFMDQGYHATSMRQIADESGLALGGIYNHFASKEELFEAIVIDKHPYRKVLPAILESKGNTLEEFIANAFRITIAEISRRPEYINLMFIELVEFKGIHGKVMLKEIAPQALPIFEPFLKGRKDLRVKNPAFLMRSFFGMIISYFITNMLVSNSMISKMMPANVEDAYIDVFLHGILKEQK